LIIEHVTVPLANSQ